ncbi:MAG: hypothetical protein AAFR46_04360 [Pseudomonadota bacterium]
MADNRPSELVVMLLVLLGLAALVGLLFASAAPEPSLQPAFHHAPALTLPVPLPEAPPAPLHPAPLHPAQHAMPSV